MESHAHEPQAYSEGLEGRYATAGAVSVAFVSAVGPRDQNQDAACCRIRGDGSWLVAVADGLGGHPRGRAAARRAIKALPGCVAGAAEMHAAFQAGHQAVTKLAPSHLRQTRRDLRMCPATTLSVAAWTAETGLTVGIAGDTRTVVLWRDDAGWHGRSVGRLHRSAGEYGYLVRYLGAPLAWPPMGETGRDPMDIFTDADIDVPTDLTGYATVIASDGAWEPLTSDAARPVAHAIAAAVHADDDDARIIADRIMDAALKIGLADNATVAVAAVIPTTDADATR